MRQHGLDLEIVTLREVSQTEKQKHCMNPCIWNLKRHDTNELVYKTETDSDLENEFMVAWGEG